MPITIAKLVDQVELYAKNADPKLVSNHELVRDILNQKLRDFSSRTGILASQATISSVADQQEYELPADCLHVSKVVYDDYRANKIDFSMVEELQGKA